MRPFILLLATVNILKTTTLFVFKVTGIEATAVTPILTRFYPAGFRYVNSNIIFNILQFIMISGAVISFSSPGSTGLWSKGPPRETTP